MCARIKATNVSLTTQCAHEEDTTTIATMILVTSFLLSAAMRASPCRNRDPPMPQKNNARGRAEEFS